MALCSLQIVAKIEKNRTFVAIMEWLMDLGYAGLFVGAFLAATVIPFSSDVQLVAMLALGSNPFIAVSVATLGNWLGGLTSYGLGYAGRWDRIERWLRVKRETLEKQRDKVQKYGSWLALMTWLPIVGDVMAVALGFYKIDFKGTALFMLIGKGLRFVMWAVIFYYIKPLLG